MKNKIAALILLTAISFTLTGCWDYNEVNDIWMVGGLAIDWDAKAENYILTAEIIRPTGGKDTSIKSQIITFSSETIFDGMRKSISSSGKKLYWAHTNIIIIGQEVARRGIIPILDIVKRSDEFRTNVILTVSKEKTAQEILRKKIPIADASSFELEQIFSSQPNISTFIRSEMWFVLEDLLNDGISPVISTIEYTGSDKEKITRVDGVAAFKGDKLRGYLNGSETKSLLFVRNMLKGGDIPLINVADTNTSVTLEILQNKTELKPQINGDEINMNINIKVNVAISELEGPHNFLSEEGLKQIKAAANKRISNEIYKLTEKCQNELDCDVLGFGKSIQKNYPREWKKLKPDWAERFKTVNVSVKVEPRIISSYRSYKSINGGD